MARKVFFSFYYARDAWRVAQVRKCNVISTLDKSPFYDKAKWEQIKRSSPTAIRSWIEDQLAGTSVTVVLIGQQTASRPWVKYEIERSVALKKGMIGIRIHKIADHNGKYDDEGPNPLPAGYPVYLWNNEKGEENLGKWIEKAAAAVGR